MGEKKKAAGQEPTQFDFEDTLEQLEALVSAMENDGNRPWKT